MANIKMRGPKACADSLSFGGESYSGKKGVFEVPAEAAEHLKRHGFVVDGEAQPDANDGQADAS
jgi:hypothetical protein